ncbi:Hypothetical predicted protein [Octopus vulgaris]|uniref:Uncharacterized protein n=1 Tax=Octopus vulgaris TaxID=6645 RepID=A0AA36APD4_OCTVU|nr:Hypothetical predicted protein [Octopus vulgaris]
MTDQLTFRLTIQDITMLMSMLSSSAKLIAIFYVFLYSLFESSVLGTILSLSPSGNINDSLLNTEKSQHTVTSRY